jgi:hypothetical protein
MHSLGSPSSNFLDRYVTERLPAFAQGSSEVPGDPPSFTVDQRYRPMHDPVPTR